MDLVATQRCFVRAFGNRFIKPDRRMNFLPRGLRHSANPLMRWKLAFGPSKPRGQELFSRPTRASLVSAEIRLPRMLLWKRQFGMRLRGQSFHRFFAPHKKAP